MDIPVNSFKHALATRQLQIGLWSGLADAYCAEICAGAGFDWMVLDAEHAPNDIRSLLAQLQTLAPYPVAAAIRAASCDTVHIKQLLDIGAQTLLIPVVETAQQAVELVRAARYPPTGWPHDRSWQDQAETLQSSRTAAPLRLAHRQDPRPRQSGAAGQ